jgi:uncharacterized repeat protein (TIGR01451 family)
MPSRRIPLPMLVCFFLLTTLSAVRAQAPSTTVSLSAVQFDLDRLSPGQTAGEAVFAIDKANNVLVELTSDIGALDTKVISPSGQEITPGNAGLLGGSFALVEGAGQQTSSIPLTTFTKGFHYVYAFPWQGLGAYKVVFQAPSNLQQEAAVITQVTTDSVIGATLIATETRLVEGRPQVLTAAVFEGATPVAGASVTVTVMHEGGSPTNITLKDDGQLGDGAAGDGLYSGVFTTGAVGRYDAKANITGASSGGSPFARQSAASFEVLPAKADLAESFQDQGVDANADGLLDRVDISVQPDVVKAGKFRAFITLKTAGGKTLIRSADAQLAQGSQNMTVGFEADALRELGEDGPYDVDRVELLFLDASEATPADTIFDVGKTKAYKLSQFQRPAILLTGASSDQGIDTNGNGLFNRLRVSVQVDVLSAGSYSWSMKIADQSLKEIDLGAGSGSLAKGVNTIQVEFDGSKIGASGADGPYLLRDLLMFGPSASLVSPDAGKTKSYRNIQFEGFTRPSKEADISVAGAASPDPVVPGGNLSYMLTVTNGGPDEATGVTFKNTLPAGTSFVSCSSTEGGVCGGAGGDRTVTFASLPSGKSAVVTIVAAVSASLPEDAIISNAASASSAVSDPDATNNASSTETSLVQRTAQFSAAESSVGEAAGFATFTVSRAGSPSGEASVDYTTGNGTAVDTLDYTASLGTLHFAPGETEKTVTVLITDDAFEEGAETLSLTLSNPVGMHLGATATTTLSIEDNDSPPSQDNPLGDAAFFVRQHYHDFLNREPDSDGLAFWTDRIASCSQKPTEQERRACFESRRLDVSTAFFLSIEYQQTGHLVFCFYKASFPDSPSRPRGFPLLREFLRDTQQVGRGVIVGQGAWQARLDANKGEFALQWVRRPDFLALYPETMPAEQFVDALFANAGVSPTAAERAAAVAAFGGGGAEGRARALRSVVEDSEVCERQFNAGLVLMEYFGYLRRNPSDAPEPGRNLDGYDFWLMKLDSFTRPGEDVHDERVALVRIRRAEIVKSFLISQEYVRRFGPGSFSLSR